MTDTIVTTALTAKQLADADYLDTDTERAAALWLLSDPLIAGRALPFVDIGAGMFDFDGLLGESRHWSTGERGLVDVAYALFTTSEPIDIATLIRMDDDRRRRVMVAFEIRFGWFKLREMVAE